MLTFSKPDRIKEGKGLYEKRNEFDPDYNLQVQETKKFSQQEQADPQGLESKGAWRAA